MKDKRPPKVVIRIYSRYVDVAVRKVRFSYARISALSRKIGVVVLVLLGMLLFSMNGNIDSAIGFLLGLLKVLT